MILPLWMRVALWATAAMNILGAMVLALSFVSGFSLGLPPAHPLFGLVLAEFIFLFGVAYAYCAWTGRAPRLFIALGAAGKLAFFATLAAFWLGGDVPFQTALGASGDLFFGCAFLVWLMRSRRAK